jgi:hypothetical protein
VRHDPVAQANPERRQRRAQHQRIAEEDDGRDPTARQLFIGRITVTDDTDRQCKQSALFAGDGKTESQPCESEPEIRPPFPKAGDKRCDRQQAERERGNISIAIPDCTNTIWLRKGSTQMRAQDLAQQTARGRTDTSRQSRAIRTARSDSASPAAHLRTPESIPPSTLSPAADASGRAAGSA